MYNDKKIAIVIPTYKAFRHILSVIDNCPDYVDVIVVVDDACPENSGKLVKEKNSRAIVLLNETNQGVGGATIKGFKYVFEKLSCDIAIKIDADGQISPNYVNDIMQTFHLHPYGYVKGSRFLNLSNIGKMPKIRVILNSILSFVSKFSTGYYKITDPTNGLIAINQSSFMKLDLKSIAKRFFFESDMLFHLNINRISVTDIPIEAIYANEVSNLRLSDEIWNFALGNVTNFIKRIFLRHFIGNFHLPAIYLLFGFPLLMYGITSGIWKWSANLSTNVAASPGEVMLPSIFILVGLQFLMQFFQLDIIDEP